MRYLTIILASSLALAPIGCSKPAEPKVPSAGEHSEFAPRPAKAIPKDDASSIVLSERLRRLCEMEAAYFAFDSAALDVQTVGALDQLANCFTSGAAKDKSMSLVGHADPRGEEIYNMGLGQRRAGSVAKHLGTRGLAERRMETSSRGELDATGYDETTWAKDRRVAIDLADE